MNKRWIFFVVVAPMVLVAVLVAGLAMYDGTIVHASPAAPADVFLQGQYVEAGINGNGHFGSSTAAPPGYHPNDTGHPNQLGFVADYQMDGWSSGTPAYGGDFFLPGSPYEALVVEWTTGAVEHTYSNYMGGSIQITPTTLTDTSSGMVHSAVWVGEATNVTESVRITITHYFTDAELAINMDIEIQNIGSATLDSVEFARVVDPDNEQPWTGSYVTTNTVVGQPGVGGNPDLAVVKATGVTYPDMVVAMITRDARAKVSASASANPDTILDSPVTGPLQSDARMGLAYRFGTLAPGDTVRATMEYALAVSALPSIDETDLAIDKDVELRGLSTVTYTLVARNLGPNAADGAVVSDTLSNVTGAAWTCVAAGGAAPATGNGTGDVQHTLTAFPVDGVVTCTVSGTLVDWGYLKNTAEIVPPAGVIDTDESNRSATVERWQVHMPLIFRNYTL